MEIASGDDKTIWEFLDDIWYFYSNKNHEIGNRRKKNKISLPGGINSDESSISHNLNNNLTNIQKFKEKNAGKGRDEPVTLRDMNNIDINSNKYSNKNNSQSITNNQINPKLDNYEIPEEIQKCADFTSIQKNISNEISVALNKNTSNHSTSNLLKKPGESNEKYSNSEIIAKNLGLTKIRKRSDNLPLSNNSRLSFSNCNNDVSNTNTGNYLLMKKAQSNLNFIPSYSSRPGSSRSNANSRNRSNLKNENHYKSTDKRKDCFVIFQKTNAKKLQKEIERYNNSLVSGSGYNSENSIVKNDENSTLGIVSSGGLNNVNLIGNINITNNKYRNNCNTENINLPRPFTNIPTILPEKQLYPKDFPILNTEDSNKNTEKVISSENENDNFIMKEWLMSIGSKSAYKIEFTSEEIEEFKDGILLAEIISILENNKLSGINPNPNSKAAAVKNISKCLEILRNRKVELY
jgi:hypothetical protein